MAECAVFPLDTVQLGQFEREQQTRRVHWSSTAWQQILKRSLPPFIFGLEQLETPDAQAALLSGYLTIVAEGIGLQHLYPHPPAAYPNIFSVVLEHVIPQKLQTIHDPKEQVHVMSQLWNLCEAVSEEPAWVEAALIDEFLQLDTLRNLAETCHTMQRELTQPAPQLISSMTDPAELHYSAIPLWPPGFFLPETVTHCGPNVFLVRGISPGVSRSFYVLSKAQPRVLSANRIIQRSQPGSSGLTDGRASKLIRRTAQCQLPLLSVACGESAVAAVCSGSQQLHLWRVSPE